MWQSPVAAACHFYFDAHTGKMVVDPATFHYVAQKPTGFLDFFTSINKGFKGGITIIAFLFMVGGSLNILPKTGAIVAGLSALVKKNTQSQHSADSGADDYFNKQAI